VRTLFGLCGWLLAARVAFVAFALDPQAGSLDLANLRVELAKHVSQEKFRGAQWGIKVISLASGASVFEHNADKLLKPASTAKLFTGALALDVLGADFRIQTSIYASSKPLKGILSGDLIVFGRGDPSFSREFEPATNVLRRLIQSIREAGLREVRGDLITDSTFFTGSRFGTGWTWDDLGYYYGPEITALAIDDNALELRIRGSETVGAPCELMAKSAPSSLEIVNRTRTLAPKARGTINVERSANRNRIVVFGGVPKAYDSWVETVSIPDAPLWFGDRLKEELARAGITVTGRVRSIAPPEDLKTDPSRLVELGRAASPPIGAIVQKMMKASNNFYAQLLLLQVGAKDLKANPNTGTPPTEELGIRRLMDFAGRAGIPTTDLLLDDGTGLSRSGLVSPRAIVQLLRYMATHPAKDSFRASLPEAGTDGTLRPRLKELKGRLWAKTGTLQYVNTLAGYLVTVSGEQLAFAMMLNAYAPPVGDKDRDELDTVVRLLARLGEPSRK